MVWFAPRVGGHREPGGVGVADRHVRRPAGPGGVGAEQPDRSGAGHQHPVAGRDVGLASRPDPDRQRLDQGRRLVAHAVRHRVGADRVQHHVLGEGPMDRRRGEELDVRAQVVAPGQALPASAAGLLRLQRDPLTRRTVAHLGSDRPDGARRLVTQHQRLPHHEVGDPAVVEVVHVRPADADRGHLHQHLVWPGLGHRGWLDGDLADAQ